MQNSWPIFVHLPPKLCIRLIHLLVCTIRLPFYRPKRHSSFEVKIHKYISIRNDIMCCCFREAQEIISSSFCVFDKKKQLVWSGFKPWDMKQKMRRCALVQQKKNINVTFSLKYGIKQIFSVERKQVFRKKKQINATQTKKVVNIPKKGVNFYISMNTTADSLWHLKK